MRTPSRAETREKILAGARRAVAGYGLETVTTRQVADEAGVAIGTFYRHFQSKQAVLDALGWGHAAAIASLAAVRTLHCPITRWQAYEGQELSFVSYEDLVDGYTDEGDAPTREGATTFEVCQECGRIEKDAHEYDDEWGYENAIWPCATAKAIGEPDA